MINEKLSIVVPIYNSEKYLEKCVSSILNQYYRNIEVILVDDGSTDNSKEICLKFRDLDSRIKVISTENRGVSSARNIGIENATGKYIAFVDSDDSVEPNIYIEMLKNIKRGYMPIIGYKYVDEQDHFLDEKKAYDYDGIFQKKDFFIFCENFIMNSPVNKLFYLDVIIQNDIRFDENLSLGEDLIFVLEYIKYVDFIIIINKSLYRYKISEENSLSKKYRHDFFEIKIKLLKSIYTTFFENDISDPKYKKRFFTMALDSFISSMNNIMDPKNDIEKKEKFKINNDILKSKEFKILLNLADLSIINIFTKIGFKLNSYELVYYSNKLMTILKEIIK